MSWTTFIRLSTFIVLVCGHIGLWIALYNRINATGLHRKLIKAIEKGIVLVCLILPFLLLALESSIHKETSGIDLWWSYWTGHGVLPKLSAWSWAYGFLAIGYGLVSGPIWLMHRPQFHTARDRMGVMETRIDKSLHRDNPEWPLGSKARRSLMFPGNELMHLEVNTKSLWLDSLPESFVGMRIGHLSDVHLTGQLPSEFYRHAIESLLTQGIDLLCLSGDIIDEPVAVPSLPVIFGDLDVGIPKLFVLGNHDRACKLDRTVRRVLGGLGWIDVGMEDRRFQTDRGTLVVLGNERPWFRRDQTPGFAIEQSQGEEFRLGISHAPDQIPWARKNRISLLLCGHTHGGQIRFPWIGPIIAPSRYGSRFASGVFYQSPTLMHVSRGLSGVHPIRLGCLPEVSVLELRKKF